MNILLLVLAVIAAAILALTGFGWIHAAHPLGWLGASLTFAFASFLVGASPIWPNRG